MTFELYINGNLAQLSDNFTIRINRIFLDPAKINQSSGEYSYSFDLPICETNNLIFDFINIPSKRHKFAKYQATLNANGSEIFNGSLLISSIDKDSYKCNLYVSKPKTLDAIFGDLKLTDIKDWYIPYHQATTINNMNTSDIHYPQDCFFPLVSYGLFQKQADYQGIYSSKTLIDDTNIWYNQSFYPSLNLLKTIEKAFETKGYKVNGSAFDDEILQHVYLSTNLKDKQDPKYNLGSAEMGKLTFDFSFKNTVNYAVNGWKHFVDTSVANRALHTIESVPEDYKYLLGVYDATDYYPWENINVYDILSNDDYYIDYRNNNIQHGFTEINHISNPNMFRDSFIVVPSDGYYKIKLNINKLAYKDETLGYPTRYIERDNNGLHESNRNIIDGVFGTDGKKSFASVPCELQLVRNMTDNEGICPITPRAYQLFYDKTVSKTVSYPYGLIQYGSYPHENKGTLANGSNVFMPQSDFGTLMYDPRNNPNFICGISASGRYFHPSVIKNGRSWDRTCTDSNKSRLTSLGYREYEYNNGSWENNTTDYQADSLSGSSGCSNHFQVGTLYSNDDFISGTCECIVYLKKNDTLHLKLLTKNYPNRDEEEDESTLDIWQSAGYMHDLPLELNGSFSIEAYAVDNTQNRLMDNFMWSGDNGLVTHFDENLNLAQFLNSSEKISDFISNVISEFNLSLTQSNNIITIDKQKSNDNEVKGIVNLTNKVNEIESEHLDLPKEMGVQYSINNDERGVYLSADKNTREMQRWDLMETDNFYDYADKGSQLITIDEEGTNNETVTTKTSYNWFEKFNYNVTNNSQTYTGTVDVPVIGKDEWYVENNKYEEDQKNDGHSLTRRYWFPSTKLVRYSDLYVFEKQWRDYEDVYRHVYWKKVSNTYNNFELSYKQPHDNVNQTILTKFFNIPTKFDGTVYKCEATLSPLEYQQIKNGCDVVVDDSVYQLIEINGFDPSGKNPTELKLINK